MGEQFLELCLIEDANPEFSGLCGFRSRRIPHYDVISFLGDAARTLAAVQGDDLINAIAGESFERSGDHQGQSGQSLWVGVDEGIDQ